MINGINEGLQSALQSVTPKAPEEARETAAPERLEREPESVKVSLGQTQQGQERQAVDDYRALAQKAVMAKSDVEAQQSEQAQRNLARSQAFLATAAVRNQG